MLILGSASDIDVAKKAVDVLEQMNVAYDIKVTSAHRTHGLVKDVMTNYSDDIDVFIAIAGLAAHLPGVVAAYTTKPVIGVPVKAKLGGLDSLLSCTQMQVGTPVATVGIDRADNAALIACQILAYDDEQLKAKLINKRASYVEKMITSQEELIKEIGGDNYTPSKRVEHKRPKVEEQLKLHEDSKVMTISENYSNIDIVEKILKTLDLLDITCDYKVIPSTSNPDKLEKFMKDANRQIELFIAVSDLSSVLAGAVVSHTTKPVIGVPCSGDLKGIDSLLSMVQMPPGVPTATMGIDAGENAALFIARILSNYNENIKDNLEEYTKSLKKDYYE